MIAPKLRFSEFKDDWSNALLGELSDIKTGPFGSTLHQEDYVKVGTPIITVEHLGEVSLTTQNLPLVSNEDKKRLNSYILKEGDLAFSRVGSVDRCAIITNNEEGWLFSGRILRVRPNKSIIEPKFLMYVLKTEETKFRIRSVAVGQTMPSLNTEILKNFSVDISNNRQEQTKIAEFLSSVDDKISQLSRQLELLNQYKKGVMQKIFSQEIRFKNDNGEDFGEWEEVPLNQIASKVTVKNRGNKVTEVLTNSATQGIIKQSDFFDREIVSESNINGYYVVEVDDFVYNPRISVHAPVGPIKRNKITQGIMSPLYTVFRFKEGNLDFLSYFFGTNFWHDYVKSVANSGARHDRMNITNSDFLEMPILLPSIQEQEKIAEFLTAIDERIDHTTAQLTHTKQWKKGLLQQMFV